LLRCSRPPIACNCSQGIGRTLNPSYNFSAVATPYAQELLQLQDGQQQGFIIEQLQQQATEVTQAAAAMPLRVRRIDSTLEQLETGNLKLRWVLVFRFLWCCSLCPCIQRSTQQLL
jgi:predicted unusual protein kinase regulating ubiquinone biosynthesis (AarF/ABC1/UbiB family)